MKKRPGHPFTAFLFAVASLAVDAMAGPPLLTDDPDTPGPSNWEINIGTEYEKTGDEYAQSLPVFDINYGLGERLQLKYELPWKFAKHRGESTRDGRGLSEIGLKWRFLGLEASGFSMSAYPQFAFGSSSSARRNGIVDPGNELELPIQMSKSFDFLTFFAEAGYSLLNAQDDGWNYGLAVSYDVTNKLVALAELNGSVSNSWDTDSRQLFFNAGFKWKFHERVALMGSLGHSLKSPRGERSASIAYLGTQLNL